MWFLKPEFLVTSAMWVVGVLLSLYTRETRRFLALPGKKLREFSGSTDRAHIDLLQTRITLAEKIHGDAYELIFFVSNAVLHMVISYFRALAYLFIPVVVVEVYSKGVWFKTRDILLPLLFGSLGSTAIALSAVFNDLRNYPASIEKYRAEIEQLKSTKDSTVTDCRSATQL